MHILYIFIYYYFHLPVHKIDIFHNKQNRAFVASMSDGTIATIHYYKNKYQSSVQPELCWGLSSKRNKIKLPQPVCDLGLIDNSDNSIEGNSIVACLRDGSVFVIPVTPMNNEEYGTSKENLSHLDVALYNLPQDPDSSSGPSSSIDDCKCYTQGFTSGYVQVKGLDGDRGPGKINQKKGRMVLMMFHAWAGGLIDCHFCGLLPARFPTSKNGPPLMICDNEKRRGTAWSRILASHGVLEEVISFLLSLDQKNGSLNEDSIICKAVFECKSLGGTLEDVLGFVVSNCSNGDLMHNNLASFSKIIDHIIFGEDNKDVLYI